MNELSLDGRLLQMFMLVYETSSVTEAAYRLDITQSTVSHGLARLRKITGDPLFVSAGRGIVPTPRAHVLARQAEDILMRLAQFVTVEQYDPVLDNGGFVIGAYDYEIETILRLTMPILRQAAPQLTLRVVRPYDQAEWLQVLRENRADLVLTLAVDKLESDLSQQILFDDGYACFYDSNSRSAPDSLDAYVDAPHALLMADSSRPCDVENALEALGRKHHIVLRTASFGGIAPLIKGSDIVATLPSRLKNSLFLAFSCVDPPLDLPPFQIAQIWHNRNSSSKRHQWLRMLINNVVNKYETDRATDKKGRVAIEALVPCNGKNG